MTGTVFKFEFKTAIRKKAYLITMAILLVILILMSFVPRVLSVALKSKEAKPYGFVSDDATFTPEILSEKLEMEIVPATDSEALLEKIRNSELDGGFVFENGDRTIYLKSNNVLTEATLIEQMRNLEPVQRAADLVAYGMSATEAAEFANQSFDYDIVALETDGAKSIWLVYANLFALYFLIALFGSQVSSAVAREKTDRTMELLITATKPKDLINGKVYAYGLLGILTFIILYGAAGIGMTWGGADNNEIMAVMQEHGIALDLRLLLVTFLFFVFGYLTYLYLFAAAASLVSRMEDTSVANQPLMILFMSGWFISLIGLMKPNILLTIAAFFPLTSPFAMPTYFGIESVPLWQAGVSLALLIGTFALTKWFTIKMYRLGSLNYGLKVNFFKSLFQSIKE